MIVFKSELWFTEEILLKTALPANSSFHAVIANALKKAV
jgi:hypothetical protein